MSTRKEDDRYAGRFIQFVVYHNPATHPGKFVVRCFPIIDSGTPMGSTEPIAVGSTLDQVRAAIPSGYERQEPRGLDDSGIIEVWS